MIHERKLNRLAGYDYSQNGAYFVTICAHNQETVFGKIDNGEMILNEYGKIAKNQWKWLFEQYPYLCMDEFVVMPDHFHGILVIDGVGNGRDRSLRIKPLPQLIGAFKTTSSKLIHQSGNVNFKWQKSYWDRIIRNETELNQIRQYIIDNPRGKR